MKFNRKSLLSLTILSTALLSGCSHGADNNKIDKSNVNKIVGQITNNKLSVMNAYPGPSNNMEVLKVKNKSDNKEGLAWLFDNKYLVFGTIIAKNSENLNSEYVKKYKLGPKVLTPEETYNKIKKLSTFTMGTKGPMIYEFVDPNCIFCHITYEKEKSLINDGKLRVTFIPVGFLKGQNSVDKAALILQSKDPAKLWEYNQKYFVKSTEFGGIKIKGKINESSIKKVYMNTLTLSETGELATPTIVYKEKNGKFVLSHGLKKYTTKYIESLTQNIR